MKVFVSYAREDREFRDQLVADLAARDIDAWVDEDDIAAAVHWRGEINHGIESCEALVAVVSVDSAASEICAEEVQYADQLGKRILPVVYREPGGTIPEIGERNWIFWRSGGEREHALEKIDEALTVDPEWAKQHTGLLTDALEWERHERDSGRLLRGEALDAAEAALTVDRPREQPQPTSTMREFVRSSRIAAARRQRRTAAIALGVAAVSIALALVAFVQFQRANTERERAEEQLRIATSRALASQGIQLDAFGNEATGLLLAAEAASRSPTAEARNALLRLLPDDAITALRSPEQPDSAVDRVISSDGRFEVSDDGRTVRDLDSGDTQTLIDSPDPLAVFLRDVVFSPDSSRLVVTNLGETSFKVYDLAGGLPAPLADERSAPEGERVFGAALDRGNELIAVSVLEDEGAEGVIETGLTLSVWDEVGTEVLVAPVEGQLSADFILREAFVRVSIDDDLGAIVTQWGEAQLFSARTAQLIGGMLPVDCSPDCGASAPDDARMTNATLNAAALVSTDAFGTARSFDLDVSGWIQLACDSTTERITPAQWERFVGAEVDYDPVC